MPPDEKESVNICYMYLKNGKWKLKTTCIYKEEIEEYKNKYRIQWIKEYNIHDEY